MPRLFIRQGDEGVDVKAEQEILHQMYYYSYSIDGKFGPYLEQSVKEFQEEFNIVIDGIVGPQTRMMQLIVFHHGLYKR